MYHFILVFNGVAMKSLLCFTLAIASMAWVIKAGLDNIPGNVAELSDREIIGSYQSSQQCRRVEYTLHIRLLYVCCKLSNATRTQIILSCYTGLLTNINVGKERGDFDKRMLNV